VLGAVATRVGTQGTWRELVLTSSEVWGGELVAIPRPLVALMSEDTWVGVGFLETRALQRAINVAARTIMLGIARHRP